MIMNYHIQYSGLCIKFKSHTNNCKVSDAQKEIKNKYKQNNYKFIISNDYDHIIAYLDKYMQGVCTNES